MNASTRVQGSAEAVGGASVDKYMYHRSICTTEVHVPHWVSEDQNAKITGFSPLTIGNEVLLNAYKSDSPQITCNF